VIARDANVHELVARVAVGEMMKAAASIVGLCLLLAGNVHSQAQRRAHRCTHRFSHAKDDALGRPVGVALDKRGALRVADDVGDVVWRVSAPNGALH
jgi:glucose/arabinose dehydrogenase